MMRRQTKRRTWARVGGVILSAATVAGAVGATPVWAEGNAPARSTTALASTSNGSNAFAARLVVLEFASKTDADAERTNALVNAMRDKNYPIQRVERENGGAELFDRFAVSATPTFVLLVDGKEVDRVATPGTPSAAILRNQLLRLFDRGREELATQTAKKNSKDACVTRAQTTGDSAGFAVSGAPAAPVAPLPLAPSASDVPSAPVAPTPASAPAAPKYNPISLAAATLPASAPAPIAQVSTSASTSGAATAAERAINDAAVWERLDEATVRIDLLAGTGLDGESDSATGVVAHADPRHGEALVATCGHLFRDVVDWSSVKISVAVSDPKSGRVETVVGECVYSDPETDVAFVAFRAPWTIRPVAFLPENETLNVGESALSVARDAGGARPLEHKILSLDRHYFQPKPDDAARQAFNYVQVSNAPEAGRSGGGLFVERDGKYYWAGLCVAGDPEEGDGFFVPASIAANALLSNENLAVALADQRAGKFAPPTLVGAAAPLEESTSTVASVEPLETLDSFADAPLKNVRSGRAASTREAQSAPTAAEFAAVGKAGEGVRSTSFEARGPASGVAPADVELLDAALDALRRRALEGAEIVCIVNWGAADGGARETEVVRLPRQKAGSRTSLETSSVATDSFAAPQAPVAPTRVEARASSTFPDVSVLR